MMDSCEGTAIIRGFSSSDNSSEWEISNTLKKFLITHGLFDAKFLFYADGNGEENKGYVSIICSGMFPVLEIPLGYTHEFEVHYFFSVVDISENKRFTQSIVLLPRKPEPRDSKNNSRENFDFALERYLKRESLLNDSPELLPGDCLTILVEIEYKYLPFIEKEPEVDFAHIFEINEDRNDIEIYNSSLRRYCIHEFSFSIDKYHRLCISLDTFYGRKLCSLSGFFQRAADTPLTEGTMRMIHIPNEELSTFAIIFCIVFKPTTVLFIDSINQICLLYIIADKYDFQSFFQICRQIIKAFFCTTDDSGVREHAAQNVPNITELADEYRDSDMLDIVKTYLAGKQSFGTNDYALGKYLKERIFSDWKCVSTFECRNPWNNRYQFRLSRITNTGFEFHL